MWSINMSFILRVESLVCIRQQPLPYTQQNAQAESFQAMQRASSFARLSLIIPSERDDAEEVRVRDAHNRFSACLYYERNHGGANRRRPTQPKSDKLRYSWGPHGRQSVGWFRLVEPNRNGRILCRRVSIRM